MIVKKAFSKNIYIAFIILISMQQQTFDFRCIKDIILTQQRLYHLYDPRTLLLNTKRSNQDIETTAKKTKLFIYSNVIFAFLMVLMQVVQGSVLFRSVYFVSIFDIIPIICNELGYNFGHRSMIISFSIKSPNLLEFVFQKYKLKYIG